MRYQWESVDRLSLGIVGLIALITFIAFFPLMRVIVLALSLAIVLIPYQERLARRISPALSAILITVGVVFTLLVTVILTGTVLYQNMEYLISIISSMIEGFKGAFESDLFLSIPDLGFEEMTNTLLTTIRDTIFSYLMSVPGIGVELILFIGSLYLFVCKGQKIGDDISKGLYGRSRNNITIIWKRVSDTLYSIYIVHFSIAVITFFLALPFFWLLGYDHIIFYSVLCALFALVPFLGPFVILAFLALYALSMGDIRALLLILFIGYPVLSIATDLYLRPVLMGKRVEINPVVIFIGFFGGMAVMGIIGFILGPLLLSLIIGGYQIVINELHAATSQSEAPKA
ncbi:AI-2E family transporter [Methanocalculus chunghsingensis]